MHLRKKKNRPKPQVPGCENPTLEQIDEQSGGLSLSGRISLSSISEDAGIIGNVTDTTSCSSFKWDDDDSADSFCDFTDTASNSSGSSVVSNLDVYSRGKSSRRSRKNKVIASSGTVSNIIGKDYSSFSNKRTSVHKGNGPSDVEKEKELFKSSQHQNSNTSYEDLVADLEAFDPFTDRMSDLASPSHNNLPGKTNMSYKGRSYSDVVSCDLSGHKISSTLPHDMLEALFTPKREPVKVSCRNVIKSIQPFGQKLDNNPSQDIAKKLHLSGKRDDYRHYRRPATQHWDLKNSYYDKAATVSASGKLECATYLSEEGKMHAEKARQADKRASEDLFSIRIKKFVNLLTVDLHGQQSEEGIKILKLHLLFGAYVCSVGKFRIIIGGAEMSMLKQSVVDLLQKENVEWVEENTCTLLIKLDGQKRQFGFMDDAAAAYACGKREYATYLSKLEKMCTANQADRMSSLNIFDSRNKNIKNLIEMDLHGQHVQEGVELLKVHLLFGAFVRSVRCFRVITGYGSKGTGISKLKESVVDLLQTENIQFKEEDPGTLFIQLDEQKREFCFLECGSDLD
ncbi:unnamed protein product [Lactuca virosa]|uniref:Smr domain-containing protein n=1 Tax=Lactuca virosa TaxID=75947 RepID=A0AAU9PAC8_9ASTR|nr:unnamed protein product [Lactuca virosa]